MRLQALDTETTGIDVFNDRIVTYFVGVWDTEKNDWTRRTEALVNPGIPIPQGASDVHGITDEVASQGMDPEEALEILFDRLQDAADLPLVVYNAPYDLTLINSELQRYGYPAYDWNKRRVIDPLVLERHHNKYVKGKKRLIDVVGQRGISVDESRLHTADYDGELTIQIALQQIEEWGMPSNAEQAAYHYEWAESFERFMRDVKRDESIVIGRAWPYS